MKKKLYWIPVFIWMTFIFAMSNKSGLDSGNMSLGIVNKITSFLNNYINIDYINEEVVHFVLRKAAHFIEYLLLGILIANALIKNNLTSLGSLVLSCSICIIYAMFDEYHQTYIIGRSGEIKDVIIDSFGSITGSWIFIKIRRFWEKNKGSSL